MAPFVARSIVPPTTEQPLFEGALRVQKGTTTRLGYHMMSLHLLMSSNLMYHPPLLHVSHLHCPQVLPSLRQGLTCFWTFAVAQRSAQHRS